MKLARLIDAVGGARLCYGEPVQVGAAKVIPVARVRATGGGGFGGDGKDTGGGGGGWLDAQPVGFIHVTATDARYEAIPDPERLARNVKTIGKALTALAGVVLGAKQLREGRRSPARRLLKR